MSSKEEALPFVVRPTHGEATGTCAINLRLLLRHVMQGMASFPVSYPAPPGQGCDLLTHQMYAAPIVPSHGTVGWRKRDHTVLSGRSSSAMTPQLDGRGVLPQHGPRHAIPVGS